MSTMSLQEMGQLAQKAKYEARRSEYEASPKTCAQCKVVLPYEQKSNKFCGMSCAAINRNTGRYVSKNRNFTCKGCGTVVNDNKFALKRVYCSLECQRQTLFDSAYEPWLVGANDNNLSARTTKRFVIKRDGYQCRQCGIEEWNNAPIGLELEHANGNSSDNGYSNVLLLCPNCHSQTHTYKARNKGNGRHARRERYAEGLSY